MIDLQDNLSLARLRSAPRPRIHTPPRRWAGVGWSRHDPLGWYRLQSAQISRSTLPSQGYPRVLSRVLCNRVRL